MEELIRQAFLHIEVIGPHVAEGHYDLVGPNGDIILPQVWETVVEPDWTITMHMWPIPEKPKSPEPQPSVSPEAADIAAPPPPEEVVVAPPEPPKKPGMFLLDKVHACAAWLLLRFVVTYIVTGSYCFANSSCRQALRNHGQKLPTLGLSQCG